ncbi:general stress protein [Telmatobacter sp. DSM 110680]|uniref:General stress protein n=1 Tax=Telmatobacter sp. DSM 110680 TaxID=3036704 RepID=A0AAU7DJS8_9BACT
MAQTDFSTGALAAYFENSSDARKAVDALQKAGFSSAHLGVAHHGSYTGESSTFGNTIVFETEDKEPSTWDKIKSWFSGSEAEARKEDEAPGDAANRKVIPPAAERLDEGYDEGYDDTSDLQGSFTAMNIPDDRARYFAHRFRRGKDAAVVTVQAGDRTAEAQSILAQHNADFGESAVTYEYAAEDRSYPGDHIREDTLNDTPRNVQLLGVLRVQTVRVIPADQALGRKDPGRELPGDVDSEGLSDDEETGRERSA